MSAWVRVWRSFHAGLAVFEFGDVGLGAGLAFLEVSDVGFGAGLAFLHTGLAVFEFGDVGLGAGLAFLEVSDVGFGAGLAFLHTGLAVFEFGDVGLGAGLAVFEFGDVGFGAGLAFGHSADDIADLLYHCGQVGDDFGQAQVFLAEEVPARFRAEAGVALQGVQNVLVGVDGNGCGGGHCQKAAPDW